MVQKVAVFGLQSYLSRCERLERTLTKGLCRDDELIDTTILARMPLMR